MTSSVFGNLSIPNQQGGDRVVSKAVTTAISALFKQTDKLEATVRAEPMAKLFQGSVDGFDFLGQGLLMYSGLRVHSMEFYVQAVAIDFGAIFKGQVKLKQPTQANMRIVLSEDDLTQSFNTRFLVEKLQQIQFRGQALYFDSTQIILNDDRTLTLQSQVRVGEAEAPTPVHLTAEIAVEERRRIQFVNVRLEGDAASTDLSQALVEHLNQLLDLDQFALDGMQLRVDRIRLRNRQLTLYGTAKINAFPRRNVA